MSERERQSALCLHVCVSVCLCERESVLISGIV